MKISNIKIVAVTFLTMGMVSCSDSFLDVSSKTESNTSAFYKNQTDAKIGRAHV